MFTTRKDIHMNEDTPKTHDDPFEALVEMKLSLIDIVALLDVQIRRLDALGENYPLAEKRRAS
jgi:hypothetical protein